MRRVLFLLTTVIGAVALVLAIAPAAEAAGADYVALGDSYSSGVGAGDYTSESGDCDRSPNAYSARWADANAPASYTSVACSGATTADVASSQLSALSPATTLVSITIGGNDENFATIMEDCNLGSDDTCVSEIQTAEDDAQANLGASSAHCTGRLPLTHPTRTSSCSTTRASTISRATA